MNEREAMALLVSALPDQYIQREAALLRAGGALAVLADPHAFSRQLGEKGVLAVRKAIQRREDILEEIMRRGAHLLLRGEEGYPERLCQIPRPPHLLFVMGEKNLEEELPIAIVGTRRAGDYGLRHTHAIAQDLALSGACIISGLALGVDAAAHEGALDAQGRTIAVLGGGLDRFYPAQNEGLRDRILDSGGSVVTEYPMGIPAMGNRFLLRNRIIAGLSLGVLVTQGPHRSGANRTASDAADYGREVFALPGSVEDPLSQLPHKLIAEGAHLAACATDILGVLAPDRALRAAAKTKAPIAHREKPAARRKQEIQAQKPMALPQHLTDEERAVMKALEGGEMEFDALCDATGMDGAALGAVLMGLEMEGLIDALAGLRYAVSR